MKRNRVLVTLALAGMLSAGSGAALAFGGCDGGHRGHGFGPLGAAYRVDNLTADQRHQLDAVRDKQQKLRDQMRDDRIALRDAMAKNTDAKALRPLAEKQGKDVTEMIMRRAEIRDEVTRILTPAQRTQLEQMQKERMRRFDGPRGGRRW